MTPEILTTTKKYYVPRPVFVLVLTLSKDCWKKSKLRWGLTLKPFNLKHYGTKEDECLKQTIDETVDSKSKEDGEPNGPKRLPRQKHSAHLAVFATASVLSWRLMTEWCKWCHCGEVSLVCKISNCWRIHNLVLLHVQECITCILFGTNSTTQIAS